MDLFIGLDQFQGYGSGHWFHGYWKSDTDQDIGFTDTGSRVRIRTLELLFDTVKMQPSLRAAAKSEAAFPDLVGYLI